MLDICILIIFVQYYEIFFVKIFHSWFDKIDHEVLRKVQMGLSVSLEEEGQMNELKKHYAIMKLSQLIVMPFYFLTSWHYLGGSLGQVLFGVRIVDDKTGDPMTMKQMIVRFGSCILTVATFMTGFLWSFIDKKRQSLHDKIAKTVLITKSSLVKTGKYKVKIDLADKFINPILKKAILYLKNKWDMIKNRKKAA